MASSIEMNDATSSEKVRIAERQIAPVRLFVVSFNSVVYAFLMSRAGTVPLLADAIIGVALAYAIWTLRLPPPRAGGIRSSSYFTSTADALLIVLWIYATGGVDSPFHVLLYISVVAVAFRYEVSETVVAAVIYVVSYVGLLAILGQIAGHGTTVLVRSAYVGLFAMLALHMSREVSRQMRSRAEITERLERQSRMLERRSRFLVEASAALSSSLDSDEIPSRIARLVVPALGAACLVDLVGPEGELWRAAEASAESGEADLLSRLGAWTTAGGPESPLARALERGETVVENGAVIVPLKSTGRPFGALTLELGAPSTLQPGGRQWRPSGESRLLAEELAQHAALAVENARLYREARDAVTARDAFLTMAAHELRTPLASLALYAEMLARTARAAPPNALADAGSRAQKIIGQTRRLGRLIDQLLDVSRLSGGQLTLEPEEVQLRTIVDEVVGRFEEERSRAGSTIRVETAGAPATGRWDRGRIDQVVTNLVANALKYGEGRPINIRVELAGDRASLTVRDHGMGIALDQQGRLFQRFARAAGPEAPSGIGLGLWIARQLVEAHGGSIRVESAPREGSSFIVELPCRSPPSRRAPTEDDHLVNVSMR
jgi:signal transduction histidine kinase